MTGLQNLLQISPVPMWISDTTNLNFLAVNQQTVDHFGYTEAELLKLNVADIQTENVDGELFGLLKKNGHEIYVKLKYSPINYEGRDAIVVIATDVTSDTHILKLNAERYQIISKATSDTIWDWNLQTQEIVWNKGIKGIYGYKDLVDSSSSVEWWKMRIHPDDRSKVWNSIQQHIRDGDSKWQEEYRFACADGTYRVVQDRGFMIFNRGNASIRMIGSMQDISQRRQDEQWSRLLESVVINATDAVLICSGNLVEEEQVILYVNDAFTKMSGYSKQDVLGRSAILSQGPHTEKEELLKLRTAIEKKLPCEIEVINYTKQGEEYWVSHSTAPISNAEGEVTHWITIQRDITQNRKHLQEIEDQNKKFREIAWIQSHLVRAPLARVMGLVDLLRNFTPGDDKDELLLHLTNSAKELDSIIINIADKTPDN